MREGERERGREEEKSSLEFWEPWTLVHMSSALHLATPRKQAPGLFQQEFSMFEVSFSCQSEVRLWGRGEELEMFLDNEYLDIVTCS